jgi:hypothetical protein
MAKRRKKRNPGTQWLPLAAGAVTTVGASAALAASTVLTSGQDAAVAAMLGVPVAMGIGSFAVKSPGWSAFLRGGFYGMGAVFVLSLFDVGAKKSEPAPLPLPPTDPNSPLLQPGYDPPVYPQPGYVP